MKIVTGSTEYPARRRIVSVTLHAAVAVWKSWAELGSTDSVMLHCCCKGLVHATSFDARTTSLRSVIISVISVFPTEHILIIFLDSTNDKAGGVWRIKVPQGVQASGGSRN